MSTARFDRSSAAPESEAVTLEDTAIFEAARSVILLLKKTFECWIVIGRAVVRARDIADRRGGARTFMRLIEQQGLGRVVNKATASVLLRIMARLPEVIAWRETLSYRQQIDWAAPTTILKQCPIFAKADRRAGRGAAADPGRARAGTKRRRG